MKSFGVRMERNCGSPTSSHSPPRSPLPAPDGLWVVVCLMVSRWNVGRDLYSKMDHEGFLQYLSGSNTESSMILSRTPLFEHSRKARPQTRSVGGREGGPGGGRLEGGVTCQSTSLAGETSRSAPPPGRFFASFLVDTRKEGPRQGPEVKSSIESNHKRIQS